MGQAEGALEVFAGCVGFEEEEERGVDAFDWVRGGDGGRVGMRSRCGGKSEGGMDGEVVAEGTVDFGVEVGHAHVHVCDGPFRVDSAVAAAAITADEDVVETFGVRVWGGHWDQGFQGGAFFLPCKMTTVLCFLPRFSPPPGIQHIVARRAVDFQVEFRRGDLSPDPLPFGGKCGRSNRRVRMQNPPGVDDPASCDDHAVSER